MLYRTLTAACGLLLINACASSVSPGEPPTCGPSIDVKDVVVVDAEALGDRQNLAAIQAYAIEQAGPFALASTSTMRADTFPYREPRWYHAQDAAAEKGCDILILVDRKMEQLAGDSRRSLYLYFLMGKRLPEA